MKEQFQKPKLWILFVLFPLFFGGIVYWLARPYEKIPFLIWLKMPPSPFGLSGFLPKLMIDPLPSFLWAFSMTAALWLVWQPKTFSQKMGVCFVSFLFAFLFEYLQLEKIIAGTYDILDVGGSFLAVVMAFVFLKNK